MCVRFSTQPSRRGAGQHRGGRRRVYTKRMWRRNAGLRAPARHGKEASADAWARGSATGDHHRRVESHVVPMRAPARTCSMRSAASRACVNRASLTSASPRRRAAPTAVSPWKRPRPPAPRAATAVEELSSVLRWSHLPCEITSGRASRASPRLSPILDVLEQDPQGRPRQLCVEGARAEQNQGSSPVDGLCDRRAFRRFHVTHLSLQNVASCSASAPRRRAPVAR